MGGLTIGKQGLLAAGFEPPDNDEDDAPAHGPDFL
jgi:hypothetical protein